MFKLTEYSIPDYYGFYDGNYIRLNEDERITTTTPSELFSYQVSDGYSRSRDKQFELTMVFLSDDAFSWGMDTLLWLTDSGKEGKLHGVIEGTPNRNFYMYCTCVGITAIDYDKNGAHKVKASFYARNPFWIEEETITLTAGAAQTYYDIRNPTCMNIRFKNIPIDQYQYIHFLWKNMEHGDWQHSVFRAYMSGASSVGASVWVNNYFKKIMTGWDTASFNVDKASFSGYISGEWFPTLLPANRGTYAGSYAFKFINNDDATSQTGGSTAAKADITFLKMRGLPF